MDSLTHSNDALNVFLMHESSNLIKIISIQIMPCSLSLKVMAVRFDYTCNIFYHISMIFAC